MQDLEESIIKAGFKPSAKIIVEMLALDCKMWENEQEGYYLTDYDLTNETSLKEKNMLMLFYYLKGFNIRMLITTQMIEYSIDNLWFEIFQDKVKRSIATL